MTTEWKEPSWNMPLLHVDLIQIFRVNRRNIILETGCFWSEVSERQSLDHKETKQILALFQGLKVSSPAPCHMPPWGLAFYKGDELLFKSTLCFECSNAYIYTDSKKELRAFDVRDTHSKSLFDFLFQKLPIETL